MIPNFRPSPIPLALAVLALLGPAAGAQARLEHSAPLLGRVFTLELAGAAPSQPVELFYSEFAGSSATPYGTFELRRDRTRRVRVATSDAAGSARFDFPLPLDAALAEREAHFQALVGDPFAPAGKRFTNAGHLRLLGTRVYAHERAQGPPPVAAALAIVDLVHQSVALRVDLGLVDDAPLANTAGKPVFSANFAAGAVAASAARLVFFDPFSGAVRTEQPLSNASRILGTDRTGTHVLALERGSFGPPLQPARLRAFELATGAQRFALDLPEPASELWAIHGDEVAIGAFDAASRAAIGRHVTLRGPAVLGSIALGTPLSREFDQLEFSDAGQGQLIVTTQEPFGLQFQSSLARVTLVGGVLTAAISNFANQDLPRFATVPALDRLLVSTKFPLVPSSGLFEEPLALPGPPAPVPLPWVYLSADDLLTEGTSVWVLDSGDNEPPGGTENGRLYRLDVATRGWVTHATTWASWVGPLDLELAHDALCDQLVLALRGVPPPIGAQPAIHVIDRASGVERAIALQNTPWSLHAVTVP